MVPLSACFYSEKSKISKMLLRPREKEGLQKKRAENCEKKSRNNQKQREICVKGIEGEKAAAREKHEKQGVNNFCASGSYEMKARPRQHS